MEALNLKYLHKNKDFFVLIGLSIRMKKNIILIILLGYKKLTVSQATSCYLYANRPPCKYAVRPSD